MAGIFTQIRPVQIGELENKPKTSLSATALKILSAVGDSAKQFLTPFADSSYNFLAMPAIVLKSTKWQFSSLNHQNFEFFGLVSESPT